RSHEIRIYDMESGLERRAARRGFRPRLLRIGPDGRSIAAHTADGPLSIADLAPWPYRILCDGTPSSGAALFSPDGRTLATLVPWRTEPYSNLGPVQFWDVTTGHLRGTLGNDMPIETLAFSPDGRTLATAPSREAPWQVLVKSLPDAQAL